MNERIKELARQAGIHFHKGGTLDAGPNGIAKFVLYSDMEKFAELIVGQMLDITDAHTEVFQTDRDRALIEHIKQSVKQNFGVEE